jgi:hypothetical protein
MSYNTSQLSQFNVSGAINNLHQIIHNINDHRMWWKTALVIALGFVGLAFVFIWVLYAVNENRTQEFNALVYSSASILIISIVIMTLLFFYRNSKEAFDFGDQLEGYIKGLHEQMIKERFVADQDLRAENKKTRKMTEATRILAEHNRQSAVGAADGFVY